MNQWIVLAVKWQVKVSAILSLEDVIPICSRWIAKSSGEGLDLTIQAERIR
jgi:hypothetical protein